MAALLPGSSGSATRHAKLWLRPGVATLTLILAMSGITTHAATPRYDYEGRYFAGRGDIEYLELLNTARRMFEPDPEFQTLAH